MQTWSIAEPSVLMNIKRTLCLSPETSAERDQSFRLQCINKQNRGNKGNFISIFNISPYSGRLKQKTCLLVTTSVHTILSVFSKSVLLLFALILLMNCIFWDDINAFSFDVLYSYSKGTKAVNGTVFLPYLLLKGAYKYLKGTFCYLKCSY